MLNCTAKKFSELTDQNFVKVVADVNSASKSCPENIFFMESDKMYAADPRRE